MGFTWRRFMSRSGPYGYSRRSGRGRSVSARATRAPCFARNRSSFSRFRGILFSCRRLVSTSGYRWVRSLLTDLNSHWLTSSSATPRRSLNYSKLWRAWGLYGFHSHSCYSSSRASLNQYPPPTPAPARPAAAFRITEGPRADGRPLTLAGYRAFTDRPPGTTSPLGCLWWPRPDALRGVPRSCPSPATRRPGTTRSPTPTVAAG